MLNMCMSKSIESKYEHRKPYRGAKAVDKQCRNHGECEYCKCNRLYKYKKQEVSAADRADSSAHFFLAFLCQLCYNEPTLNKG